jgi:hypothetical protein
MNIEAGLLLPVFDMSVEIPNLKTEISKTTVLE